MGREEKGKVTEMQPQTMTQSPPEIPALAGITVSFCIHKAPAGGFIVFAGGQLQIAKSTFEEIDQWFQETGTHMFGESAGIPNGIKPSVPPPPRHGNGLTESLRNLVGSASVFLLGVTAWLAAQGAIGA